MIRKLKGRYLLLVVVAYSVGLVKSAPPGALLNTTLWEMTLCGLCYFGWVIDWCREKRTIEAERWEKLYRQQQRQAGTREVYYSTLDDLLHATTDALGTFNAQQATAAASRGGDE
jgi:hypothetical protein